MPRQLPWANRGGASRTVVLKQPPKPAAKSRTVNDFDDDFFEGTVLGADSGASDDDLPTLANNGRISRKDKGKEVVGRPRMPSSSPPPLAELPPPEIEYMDKGVDKFDLRDDEYMMVEDELLQTANLFTRHLHLAEYERMKATIDEKRKNEALETPRPVITGLKPSIQGQFKNRAEKQAQAQKAFLDAEDESDQDETPVRKTSRPNVPAKTTRTTIPAKPKLCTQIPTSTESKDANTSGTDSDDLDAPKRRPLKYTAPKPTSPTTSHGEATKPSSRLPLAQEAADPTFAKPAIPSMANARARARAAQASRPRIFDDGFVPRIHSFSTASDESSHYTKPTESFTTQHLSSPVISRAPTPANKAGRSMEMWEGGDSSRKRDVPAKETPSECFAKRKADEDKVKGVRKVPKTEVDDIPTFLF